MFLKSVAALCILLASFALFNEYVTKNILKLPRPSYTFVAEQSGINFKMNALYDLNEQDRKQLLRCIIDSQSEKFSNIDSKVLNHWVAESGYSFPSGHSFNAFLLSFIMAFSMHHSKNKTARLLYVLPFIWAFMVGISRVAIGAHTPLDVSFGAAMGLFTAVIFLYFDNTKKLILPAKSKI